MITIIEIIICYIVLRLIAGEAIANAMIVLSIITGVVVCLVKYQNKEDKHDDEIHFTFTVERGEDGEVKETKTMHWPED